MMLFDQLEKILAARPRNTIERKGLIPAAVLLLLYENKGGTHLLFTKRTETVADHKGQISFPGGVRDQNDGSLKMTALREAAEEVGIDPATVRVLGLLDDCLTVATNYVITPVLGVTITPPQFSINPQEVEEILEIPLSFFRDTLKEKVVSNSPRLQSFLEYPTYHYGEHVIWGATARILDQFLSLVAQVSDAKSGLSDKGE